MKNKDLISELQKFDPECDVWQGAWNGHVETYSVIDYVYSFRYDQVSNDFFGTPGRMDKRLFDKKFKDDSTVLFLGSEFGRFPNPKVDFGDDFIDYPIKTINGENGDPDLVWRISRFKQSQNNLWEYTDPEQGWFVSYNTSTEVLHIKNEKDSMEFTGKVIGIETARNLLEACKVGVTLWT